MPYNWQNCRNLDIDNYHVSGQDCPQAKLPTFRYDTIRYIYMHAKADASLICFTEPINKKSNEEAKNKNRDAQKKLSNHKACGVISEVRKRAWWETLVNKVGFEAGVKE